MKVAIIILTMIPCIGFTQLKDDIWKVDTTRHLTNGLKIIFVQNVKFIDACNALLDAGFIIDKKDNELQTVETKTPLPSTLVPEWEPIISIRIKDNAAIIKSKIYSSIFKRYYDGIYKENKSGKPHKDAYVNAFMQAFKIAKMLGDTISYSE